MKKTIEESFQLLDELLQSVNDIVTPFSFRDELQAVLDPETRLRMREKYPKCFLPVRMGNKDIPFLPICNRNGATDRNMIAFSMKLANRLLDREDVDRGMIEITLKKLNRLNSSYSKDIPTPPERAVQKAKVTKAMTLLKKNLDAIRRGGETEDDNFIAPKPPVAVP